MLFSFKVPHNVASPGALIGASNFFELAVAVAITLFGPGSPAALACVVGVLGDQVKWTAVDRTIVMVTHDLRLAQRAKRSLRLVNGTIQANGNAQAFGVNPASS